MGVVEKPNVIDAEDGSSFFVSQETAWKPSLIDKEVCKNESLP